MASKLIYAGSGRKLGMADLLENEIKATQFIYKVRTPSPTFLFSFAPLLLDMLEPLTLEDIDGSHIPSVRNSPFSGEEWEVIVGSLAGNIPVKIWMAPEGKLVNDGDVVLVVETTHDDYAWLGYYMDAIVTPHLTKVSQMGCGLMKIRQAVRQAVIDYSDRESTDLCKLFLSEPDTGMEVRTLEMAASMFKIVSPMDPSPISMKYIIDNYSPFVLPPSFSFSANARSQINISIEERVSAVLGKTRDRHLNLFVLDDDDEEVSSALIRFRDILLNRNTPLVICLEDGDIVERAKSWITELGQLVGLEQNSLGLDYLQQQFGACMQVNNAEEILRYSQELAKAGFSVDSYSFTVSPDLFDESVSIERVVSIKTDVWDANKIDSSLPVLKDPEINLPRPTLNDAMTNNVNDIEALMPHSFVEDDDYPGRYSGWWVKDVIDVG